MINPAKLFKIKNSWEGFAASHPKFVQFLGAVRRSALKEGTVIEINVTTADGKTLSSNMKLTASDIQMFKDLTELSRG